MTVLKAPVRQQSYLTEYDKLLAEHLRKMSGSIGARDIAAESYGGKFPVGTMTAKVLGGVLARASDKRAINREERAKDFYSRAREIANAMDNPQLSRDGSTMSINPETGNFQYIPTYIPKGEQTTSVWGLEDKLDEMGKRTDALANFENLSPEDKEKARIAYESQGPLPETVEASPYSPTGIPYALKDLPPKDITEDMRYTVGEKPPEDSTQLGRYLSGTLEQDVLPTNAEKALSQALRGANVSEFEFRDYMQNRRLLNAKKPPEYKPMGGELTLYNKNTNQEIRAQRYLVVNSNGTISNVLMNIQTGELEQDPSQFTFEKPEEGSFTYDPNLENVLIITPDGGVPARAQLQYNSEGAMTGMARFNGELVKVSTLDYAKVDALKPFQVEDFEFKVNKDWKATPIVKTYNDASNQIGKLNAIREMQVTLEDKPEEFSEYVKNTLGLSKNTLASFEKTIEELGDGKAVSAGIMDWATIFLFNKMLDEQSVVRDPEVQQTMDSAGFAEGIATWLQGLEDGEKIGNQVRQGISITANIMFKSIEDRYKNELKTNADRIAIWKNRDNPATNELSYRAILGNSIKLIDPDGLLYNNGNPWEEDK